MKGFVEVPNSENRMVLLSINHILAVYYISNTETCICMDSNGNKDDPFYNFKTKLSYKDVISLIKEFL